MRNAKTKRKTADIILRCLTYAAISITLFVLVYIIGYILFRGLPHLRPELFSFNPPLDSISITPPIISTLLLIIFALIIAVPLGIFAAIYLVEYAKRDNKAVKVIRLTTETLAGIPSIVYGLFGWLFLVVPWRLFWIESWDRYLINFPGMGQSLLAGAITVSIMVLPLIIRTTEEALKSVSDSYREGSFGLGAGRLRTVFRIVVPSAVPGILAGVILAVGRIAGETAALLLTAGGSAASTLFPSSVFDSVRPLSVHMYLLVMEPLPGYFVESTNAAYATAVVLLITVAGINALSAVVAKKLAKG